MEGFESVRIDAGGNQAADDSRHIGDANDSAATLAASRDVKTDWIVIDGYRFDAAFQRQLVDSGAHVLAFDDYGQAERYSAHLILNQNFGASAALYARREAYTRLLLGSNYALLRNEFGRWREWQRTCLPGDNRVLITLGGSDPGNTTLDILRALEAPEAGELILDVVAGALNPNIASLESACRQSRHAAELTVGAVDMDERMARASVAVSAGGSTSWELCFMQLPALIVEISPDQALAGGTLGAAGAAERIGPPTPEALRGIPEKVRALLNDPTRRATMGRAGRNVVDGAGAERILNAMSGSPGEPCFIAAEVGINHNGSLALAKECIDAAADCGVDAVKFQNYCTDDFIGDKTLEYTYVSQGKTITESQHDMFKRYELKADDFRNLKLHCEKRGVEFFSTPTGESTLNELVKMGVPLLKNGSDYLVNLPLIRLMAGTGIPTILSTGMATLAEIDDAVRAFDEAGGNELVLLHCVSSYPTPAEDVHLRKIPALAAAFGRLIGFSDHTWGIVAAAGAVALGACFIEKHFTLDQNLPGPDHHFSSNPAEMRACVQAVRTIEKNLGESSIGPTKSESSGRRDFRLSCAARTDLPAGHLVSEADVVFRRPGTGIPPAAVHMIVKQRLRSAKRSGMNFEFSDFS
jgi:N,N'-diacetyllegionaminate synthase